MLTLTTADANERLLRSAALASVVYHIKHAAAGTAAEG